jgi:hypothetical protein
MVDVPAHHTVGTAFSSLSRHRHLKVCDIADSALDLELEVARQTPVGQAQACTQTVEPSIDLERELVGGIA